MWYSVQDRRKSILKPFGIEAASVNLSARTEISESSAKLNVSQIFQSHITSPNTTNKAAQTTPPEASNTYIIQEAHEYSNLSGVEYKEFGTVSIVPTETESTTTIKPDVCVKTTSTMSGEAKSGANGVPDARENGSVVTASNSNTAQPSSQNKDKSKSQGQSKTQKQNPAPVSDDGTGTKLTGAQLKKQKAAEKAARRAEKTALKGNEPPQPSVQLAQRPVQNARRPSQTEKETDKLQPAGTSKHQRKPSNQQDQGAVRTSTQPTPSQPMPANSKAMDKKVPFVSHLYPTSQAASLVTSPREIHPAVLTLALHLRGFVIAGSTARTIALLLTMKRVVNSYTTPPNVALSWHLVQHIGRQIGFLSTARPNGIAQGNAIRWLKQLISAINVSLDETAAKKYICEEIDNYIHVKFLLAGQVIAEEASKRINDSETIVVYGKSSVVEKSLLKAAETKSFKVVVVDSRPLFEGRNLAKGLLRAGMREGGELSKCSVVYSDMSGLADIFEQHSVTKCLLGASGMLGNGSLYSRAGTAMVAMMAKANRVPVIVLSETEKFTSRMVVNSLVLNELGDADWLVEKIESRHITVEVDKTVDESKKGKKKVEEEKGDEAPKGILEGWRDQQNLYLLDLLYDMTPKDFIDLVICEMGVLPPAAVPVVKRDSADDLPQ